jgi:hypothetical protein
MNLPETNGRAGGGSVVVTSRGVRLPEQPCKYVKIENWHVLEDFATANAVDVLWGYDDGRAVHWLRAGVSSDFLPVSDCQQIFLRTGDSDATKTVTIYYSYYN